MDETTFLMQVKRTKGVYEKGVVVKDDPTAALQSFHAYLGAYGYGKDDNTDYVFCMVVKSDGAVIKWEKDDRRPAPEPEPEPEEVEPNE